MTTVPPGPAPGPTGLLAPLALVPYRRLWLANVLWWQAAFMENTVTGWLALELTNSAWHVALVQFYYTMPALAAGFATGPLSERFGRVGVARASQAGSLLAALVVAVLVWTGRLAFWHLCLAAAVFGVCWVLGWTTRNSLVPDLVGRGRTVDAMVLDSFAQNLARVLGPFASGGLIALLGAGGCYAAIAAVSVVALAALVPLAAPVGSGHLRPAASQWTQMAAGLSYCRRSQPILGDLLVTLIANYLVFPYLALLPVFARDVLHRGPVELGLLGAAVGAGAFVGLAVTQQARRHLSNGWILSLGSGALCLSIVAFAASQSFPLSLALLVVAGAGQACFGVMQSAIPLTTATDEMRDRAMGGVAMAIGSGPPGRLQMGALAQGLGAPLAVGASAAAAALLVVAVTAALPGLRRGPPATS